MTISEAVANPYEKVMHRQEDGNQKAAGLNPGAKFDFRLLYSYTNLT